LVKLLSQDAGVVDQDVDAAPLFLGACDHLGHLLVFGHRPAVGDGFAAAGKNFLDDLLRRVRSPGAVARSTQIVDHDFGAAPSQFERIGAAQPTAGAGNDSDPVLERNRHACSLQLRFSRAS
jgi:hypothetical protein